MKMKKAELCLLLSGGNVAVSVAFWKFAGGFYVVSLFARQVPGVLDALQLQDSSAKQRFVWCPL